LQSRINRRQTPPPLLPPQLLQLLQQQRKTLWLKLQQRLAKLALKLQWTLLNPGRSTHFLRKQHTPQVLSTRLV
jgi:hypothetical protein